MADRMPRADGKDACAGISPLEVINKMREMQEKLKVGLLSLHSQSSLVLHSPAPPLQHSSRGSIISAGPFCLSSTSLHVLLWES